MQSARREADEAPWHHEHPQIMLVKRVAFHGFPRHFLVHSARMSPNSVDTAGQSPYLPQGTQLPLHLATLRHDHHFSHPRRHTRAVASSWEKLGHSNNTVVTAPRTAILQLGADAACVGAVAQQPCSVYFLPLLEHGRGHPKASSIKDNALFLVPTTSALIVSASSSSSSIALWPAQPELASFQEFVGAVHVQTAARAQCFGRWEVREACSLEHGRQ